MKTIKKSFYIFSSAVLLSLALSIIAGAQTVDAEADKCAHGCPKTFVCPNLCPDAGPPPDCPDEVVQCYRITCAWSKKQKFDGGAVVPTDKFSLLTPYIGLTSTIIVATVVTANYVKRVKRRKGEQ